MQKSQEVSLLETDMPTWYRLSLRGNSNAKAIRVSVHPLAFKRLQKESDSGGEYVAGLYVAGEEKRLPFSFEPAVEEGSWPAFVMPLPILWGKGEVSAEELEVMMLGMADLFAALKDPIKVPLEGHHQAMVVSFTNTSDGPSLLFDCLQEPVRDPPLEGYQQGAMIRFGDVAEYLLGPRVEFSPALTRQLARLSLDHSAMAPVEEALAWAHINMCGEVEGVVDRRTVREKLTSLKPKMQVRIHSGGEIGELHITIPGNVCGMDPDINGIAIAREKSLGYELLPNNVDNVAQQLALLVGLARLSDLVYP